MEYKKAAVLHYEVRAAFTYVNRYELIYHIFPNTSCDTSNQTRDCLNFTENMVPRSAPAKQKALITTIPAVFEIGVPI